MLRKIEVLRAAYSAYRSHFRGANAAMLQHLGDPDSAGAGMRAEARERLAALQKDYVAWLAFQRTGELPPQVSSASLDLPIVDPGTYAWRAYLTPAQRQRFDAGLTGAREYNRLGLNQAATRDAWLAADDGSGVRRALYELMRAQYNEVHNLFRVAKRAKQEAQAAQRPPTSAAPAAEPEPKGGKKAAPARRKPGNEWVGYLAPDDRRRAEALRPSYNEFSRLQQQPVERDAWLAADDELGTRRALYDRLHEDHREYNRLYYLARKNREASEAARREEPAEDERQAPGTEGESQMGAGEA
jgi:hypothetical protein